MSSLKEITVLYVEDEPHLQEYVALSLSEQVGTVLTADHGKQALEMVRRQRPDLVVTDILMPHMDGLDLAAALGAEFPGLPVIICTAFTETAYLLRAIDLGVVAYVPKPIDIAHLLAAIERTAHPILQQRELERLKKESAKSRNVIFGSSPAMQAVADQLVRTADSDFSILLQGEPGCGKSSFAVLIHSLSRRNKRPLVGIDAQARDPEQLEAELFGMPPGRGRPAANPNNGVLASVDGATLLLEAPETLPLPLQARLLRVIEERKYTPAGSIASIPCDLRILTTTSVDLAAEVRAGRFREDFLIQISDTVVSIPPLRSRVEDIDQIARRLLIEAANDLEIACPELPPESLALLTSHPWPGNCRQLRQVLRRSLLVNSSKISASTVKHLLGAAPVPAAASLPKLNLAELERWAVGEALAACGGRKMEAARMLGISYNTFKDKLVRYGVAG
jgi:DNA-binding NtrC family response regulator